MSAPEPTPAPELKTLGRYNIERTLGKGAMGVVYEGIDPKLNRRVAIKTILKSHLDPDTAKDYSMRFSREAQAVARLNHPHIVQVYDFAEEGDVAYLVMEFIRGKELKNFFDANERFDIKEAVRIMCELLDALDFAHNAGIIHRDIKPANVMLDAQARTKLTDFGVARVQDSDRTQAERTQAGTMVGTPAYMSPEQITGGTIDKRSDVFSAGIILYQFLTGEKPFTGGGAWTIAKKIIQEDPPAPSSLNNAVTPFFDAVVNKALSKNAETRYQSAKDFGVALKRALEGRGEEEDADKTIVGEMTAPPSMRTAPQPRPAAAVGGSGTQSGTQAGNQEVELEFWRAIKDGTDPDDFELYVQQFPTGIYAALAKRKIAKLRGAATDDETSAESTKQERKEADEAARKEAEARAKLADEKEKLELELARKEEEFRQREAQREAEAKASAEAAEKAQQEAAAELAKREAEYKKREAEAGEKAKQEAEKARKESEAAAKKQAEERAKREAEFKKREAELKAQAAAGGKKTSPALLAGVAVAVLAIAGTGYYFFAPDDASQRQKIAEMQKQLEAAKQQAAELEKAKQARGRRPPRTRAGAPGGSRSEEVRRQGQGEGTRRSARARGDRAEKNGRHHQGARGRSEEVGRRGETRAGEDFGRGPAGRAEGRRPSARLRTKPRPRGLRRKRPRRKKPRLSARPRRRRPRKSESRRRRRPRPTRRCAPRRRKRRRRRKPSLPRRPPAAARPCSTRPRRWSSRARATTRSSSTCARRARATAKRRNASAISTTRGSPGCRAITPSRSSGTTPRACSARKFRCRRAASARAGRPRLSAWRLR